MLTQIYEVSSPAEADAVSAIGVDHVGVLVGDGSYPRELSQREAAAVIGAVRPPAKSSALLLSANAALIETMARALKPAILHLGAASDLFGPAQVRRLRQALPHVAIMRSVPVTGPESVAIAQSYDGLVDFLLLDSHRAGDTQIGALGLTHDWTISRLIVDSVRTPVILAGGLGPDNVADAIAAVRPAGVDSKTRTDRGTTHTKDLALVRAFHRTAKSAASCHKRSDR
jgi:phosphoribosylanthranilate isomerase